MTDYTEVGIKALESLLEETRRRTVEVESQITVLDQANTTTACEIRVLQMLHPPKSLLSRFKSPASLTGLLDEIEFALKVSFSSK